jgi:hypothetical protein
MPYVVFQISAAVVVHNGHGDDDHDETMVMKIIRSWLLYCKSHIHCLKQKEEGESSFAPFRVIGMSFLSWLVCLLAKPYDMEVTAREGRCAGKKGRGFRIKGLDPLLLWISGPSMG